MPVSPPHRKKKKNELTNKMAVSIFRAPFSIDSVQFTSLTIAGSDIITVTVLYSERLRWSRPTRYMWCPHTRKPM